MNLPPYPVNLNIQLIPMDTADNAYPLIDKVVALIAVKQMPYKVGPFGTSVEGKYAQLQQLVDEINSLMLAANHAEWVLNLQWHIKSGSAVSMEEKVAGR